MDACRGTLILLLRTVVRYVEYVLNGNENYLNWSNWSQCCATCGEAIQTSSARHTCDLPDTQETDSCDLLACYHQATH